MMIRNNHYLATIATTPTALIVVTGVVLMIAKATVSFFITTTTTATLFRSIMKDDDNRIRKKKKKKNNKNNKSQWIHILRMNYYDQVNDDDDIDSDEEVENDHHDGSIDVDDNHNKDNDYDYQQDENNNNNKNAYEQLIGNTPLILLNNLSKLINRNIYVKMECYNPSGTGKDRAAYHMIHIAEITNQLPKPIPIIQMTKQQQQSVIASSATISSSSSLSSTIASANITNGNHHNMKSINDEQNDENQQQQTQQQESIQKEKSSDDIDNIPINSGTSIEAPSNNNNIIPNNDDNNNNNNHVKQQYTKQQRQQQQQKKKNEDNIMIYHQLIKDAMTLSRTGGLVIEGSSGSTGIAVANQCYYKGHGCIIILPDDQSYEKANIISQLFHAVIHIVPTASISNPYHYLNISKRIYQIASSSLFNIKAVFLNQFENLANYYIHYQQTGPEIYQQFYHEIIKKNKKKNKNNMKNKDNNDQLNAFVMSAGTGGTISGIGQYLKERIPNIQIILIDPPGSILYNKIIYNVGYTIQQSERDLKRHRYDTIVEGIGLDRITANIAIGLKEDEFEEDFAAEEDQEEDFTKIDSRRRIIDTAIQVTDQDCIDMAHYILQLEGILIGSSSSMNIVGAIEAASTLPYNSNIITIICDTGYRHITRFYNPTFIQSKDLIWPTITTSSSTTTITSSTTPSTSSTTNVISEIPQQNQQQGQQDQSSSYLYDDSVSSSSSSTIRIPRCIQSILAKEQQLKSNKNNE